MKGLRGVQIKLRKRGFFSMELKETQIKMGFSFMGWAWRGYYLPGRIKVTTFFDTPRDVPGTLFHEYGHAILDHHLKEFRAVGGWKAWWACEGKCGKSNCSHSVTDYAMTNRDEDFCETFEAFMQDVKFTSVCIRRKFTFLRRLGEQIGNQVAVS